MRLVGAAGPEKPVEVVEMKLPDVLQPGLRACHSVEHPAAGERGPECL
jgi:hypothetical protein